MHLNDILSALNSASPILEELRRQAQLNEMEFKRRQNTSSGTVPPFQSQSHAQPLHPERVRLLLQFIYGSNMRYFHEVRISDVG